MSRSSVPAAGGPHPVEGDVCHRCRPCSGIRLQNKENPESLSRPREQVFTFSDMIFTFFGKISLLRICFLIFDEISKEETDL